MELSFDALFQALFESPVPRIVVRADAPDFTIVKNNKAHQIATNLVGRDIAGKTIPEVFSPHDAGDSGQLLMKALNEAQHTNRTVLMPPFRYDMPSSDLQTVEEKWWRLEIMPLGEKDGKPEYLMATTHNITDEVSSQHELEESRRKEQLLNEELATINEELTTTNEELLRVNNSLDERVVLRTKELTLSEEKFRLLVEQAPVAIAVLTGEQHIVDSANHEMLKLWNKSDKILGLPILSALPEMEGQPYPDILREVLQTGVPYYGNESEVVLFRNNRYETGFFNFINQPLENAHGRVDSILVVANEVTAQVLARRKIEESESNLHTLIMTARYPLMILRGPDWIVEIANKGIADLWNKSLPEITGRKLMEILPELAGQPFPALLNKVFASGISYGEEEEVFFVDTPQGPVNKYISFYYDPIFEGPDVTGIIVTAHDITHMVEGRKELERAYEQIRLSKEAAQLGLFDMNVLEGTLEWDERCRVLFGVSHHDEIDYERDFLGNLHTDDKQRMDEMVTTVLNDRSGDGHFDAEYRTIGATDGRLRWVRAKGRVFYNDEREPIRFTGSVIDITDSKIEEQRKSDFIGMVSHELKTPLTSLKAHIQLLQMKLRNSEDAFTTGALAQADKQIRKMTGMINGFLDISRLENGNLFLNQREFEIGTLIQEVIYDISLTVNTHQLVFNKQAELAVYADEDKINQVIYNLVSNALKYSENGSTVEVAAGLDKNEVMVSVKDEGIGIKNTDLKNLFSKYYRVEAENTQFISGFGISLHLCAEIIRLHGGRIWAESEIGQGTTFTFTLPLVKQPG